MSGSTGEYLGACSYIDRDSPAIVAQAFELKSQAQDENDLVKQTFEFVRDQVRHSWDQYEENSSLDIPLTLKASEVLANRTGFCYAKSHLLAALLRANEIPTALCYQRVRLNDEPRFCLHGLNAVFLSDYGWYRLDPRGNNQQVNSDFCPPVEKLALELFGLGEFHLEGLFAEPKSCVVDLLNSASSVSEVAKRISETDELAL